MYGHLLKYIGRENQEMYFLQSYKKCMVFLTIFANLINRNIVLGTVFFFSISVYTPKVTKQKYIRQCPDDIYLILSWEGIKILKYTTNINE